MDNTRFSAPLRFPSGSSSRRSALRLLGGSVLGGLFTCGALSADAKKRGKGKRKKKRTVTAPPVTSPSTPVPPPPAALSVAYECPGTGPGAFGGINGTDRAAQRFVAGRSGSLRQIRFDIAKDSSSPGDWVVQLVKVVGTGNTKPSNSPLDVLAANTIPDASLPDGESDSHRQLRRPDAGEEQGVRRGPQPPRIDIMVGAHARCRRVRRPAILRDRRRRVPVNGWSRLGRRRIAGIRPNASSRRPTRLQTCLGPFFGKSANCATSVTAVWNM